MDFHRISPVFKSNFAHKATSSVSPGHQFISVLWSMSLPLPVRLENLKDRISIIKEKIRYRLFKSQMAKKTPRAKVPDSERETSKKVSSLVIAVSGTIPGRTHGQFQRMNVSMNAPVQF